jgi:diphthamide synthase (EF-2-diphthine--ammonia ligase)
MGDVVCSWSGGKESALALEETRTSSTHDPVELLTTVAAHTDRISIHGVRTELLERQARRLDLPINVVAIPKGCSGEEYVDLMEAEFAAYRDRGVERLILGDVFVEDDDDFRGQALDRTGLETFCPLYGEDCDPAGEDGEYHTFVYDGPGFETPVSFERGEVVEREIATGSMVYCDLVPT